MNPIDPKAYNTMGGWVKRKASFKQKQSMISGIASYPDNVSISCYMSYELAMSLFTRLWKTGLFLCNQTVGSQTSAPCDTHISPEASSHFSGKRVAYGDSQGSAELAPWLTTVKSSYWSGCGQCWYHIQILTLSIASIHDSLTSFAFSYREPEIPEDVCSPPHSPLSVPKTITQ